tara:strand:- start:874 stop:1248 length:375 start_codon:yes stop_codon:yes gene_type:complete
MRYSRQREKIKNIVCDSNSHPNADWIFRETKKEIPNISLGTVYRNLKQLEKSGQIKSIHNGGSVRYDGNVKKHNHLRCTVCDDLIDIQIAHDVLYNSVINRYNFKVDEIELTIIGRCEKHLNNN